jgi:hypothetical protein
MQPQFSLKLKDADGNLVNLSGIFEGTTKTGLRRLSGFDKRANIGYSLLPQTKRDTNEDTGNLTLSIKEGVDGPYSKLCVMEKRSSKDGNIFYAGKSSDGQEYLLFTAKPRDNGAVKQQPRSVAPTRQQSMPMPPRQAPNARPQAAPQVKRSFTPPTGK